MISCLACISPLTLSASPFPSVYSVYESTGATKLTWRLSGNELSCVTSTGNESCDYAVKVLAEELAYNKSLKQFKMFIIEKPLDPNYKASVVLVVLYPW